jgi:hypothetical protein
MSTWLRDSTFGLIVRYVTKNKVFKYEEELDSFECPAAYTGKE